MPACPLKYTALLLLFTGSMQADAQPNPPAYYIPAHQAAYADSVLRLGVTTANQAPVTVTFIGRKYHPASDSSDFTIAVLPDAQYYTGQMHGGSNAIFKAQTQWIHDNQAAHNIRFVSQLGDCVEHGDNNGNDTEWRRADTALSTLEQPLPAQPWGLPYGICVGNHDQSPAGFGGSTLLYNQFFGSARFQGRQYYAGHYGTDNDNHAQVFSAAGLDFIHLSLEYDPMSDTSVLHWADSMLSAHPHHKAIISSHWLLNPDSSWSPQGIVAWHWLRHHPGLGLMLTGHVHPNGEARRSDTFQGRSIHTLLSNYQDRNNGGDGWMRLLRFNPKHNTLQVRTFSPTLNQFETDTNSAFTLPYALTPPWDTLGTDAMVASGNEATVIWQGLRGGLTYEWYVVIRDDSGRTFTSPVQRFKRLPAAALAQGKPGQWRVYPNPVQAGIIHIEAPEAGLASIVVFNALGQEMLRQDLQVGGNASLPLPLPAGLYQMLIRMHGGLQRFPLLIR